MWTAAMRDGKKETSPWSKNSIEYAMCCNGNLVAGKLDKLYVLGCLGLVLLLLILLTLWSKEIYLCFKKRKCNKFFYSAKEKKLAAIKVISSNNQTTDQRMGYRTEGLKLEMPPPQDTSVPRSVSPSQYPTTPATASTPLSRHHNHHTPHTSTPLSRPRHPTEDATLDYAYDNPALSSSSPVLDKQGVGSGVVPRQESSF
uniref:(California timema) hypothetical protein n=1 Tax=Timema californicum TaxID=61474 RepID=A0A7R9JDN2_TIMCA|nr:unnamed protein product [Timema californicum]